jgi:hypothetical protein
VRVYVPLTFARLAEFDTLGSVPADVRKFVAEDQSEEAEYAALMTAADASAELSGGTERRVVLAADVVELAGGVPRQTWAAVLVDTDVHADPDDDLAWYATQEIPDLLTGR